MSKFILALVLGFVLNTAVMADETAPAATEAAPTMGDVAPAPVDPAAVDAHDHKAGDGHDHKKHGKKAKAKKAK